jgi:hypothetical protein
MRPTLASAGAKRPIIKSVRVRYMSNQATRCVGVQYKDRGPLNVFVSSKGGWSHNVFICRIGRGDCHPIPITFYPKFGIISEPYMFFRYEKTPRIPED